MFKLLTIVLAATVAAAPVAIAQTTTAPSTAPTANTKPMMQGESDRRASKLIGATVYNKANEDIGEINDLVISADKNVWAILGVGGFLGIGERNVAMPLSKLTITRDGSSWKVVVDGTKESLNAMPAYTWYQS